MKRPIESDYTSHVAYARALEEYCDWLVQPVQEPCGWQFYQDGKWHNGMETSNHRANTEAAGIPVRDVYPSPHAAPVQEPLLVKRTRKLVEWLDACEAKLKEKNT
jgi:hypothetical protein